METAVRYRNRQRHRPELEQPVRCRKFSIGQASVGNGSKIEEPSTSQASVVIVSKIEEPSMSQTSVVTAVK